MNSTTLIKEIQHRYLNYSLSVITSRALPDVRDGLKPVQRRILYAMFNNLHLYPDARYKKSASVIGEVLGKYHPHGDSACYETLVRMAQDFSLRYPLIDGQGNFGSLDGDSAAAYRYTEARLRPVAMELLSELKSKTVAFRPNFDGTLFEPIVLPSKIPNILINGAIGIAVGMATNIPPHNLKEVVDALIALIDNRDLEIKDLVKFIKGPDFPTGGEVTISKKELKELYETGQGSFKTKAQYVIEEGKRGQQLIIITSIPYAVSKSTIVEKIASIIISKKLSQLVDVRDESTDIVRIVCELKKDTDPKMIMAYLYKNTPLASNFNVNLTCLVPTNNPEICTPERLNLKQILQHFLNFRFEVVSKRLTHQLGELEKRIHLLNGFKIIYNSIDETIKLIKKSSGRDEAAKNLIAQFKLDEDQVEAILDIKLYKLAKLEIQSIVDELKLKDEESSRIRILLSNKTKLWNLIKNELQEIATKYNEKRKTRISGNEDILEYDDDDFIIEEDANVIITKDGLVRRVKELKEESSIRVREGDSVLAKLFGGTLKPVIFFTNMGYAYSCKINDIVQTTGYGDPIQKLFKFDDGERVVGALSLDPRETKETDILAVTKKGFGVKFSISQHQELSSRIGRRFSRLIEGDEIIGIMPCKDSDALITVTHNCRVLVCRVKEIASLMGPGKGVTVIRLLDDDYVVAFSLGATPEIKIKTKNGNTMVISSSEMQSRAKKGYLCSKNDTIIKIGE